MKIAKTKKVKDLKFRDLYEDYYILIYREKKNYWGVTVPLEILKKLAESRIVYSSQVSYPLIIIEEADSIDIALQELKENINKATK